MHLLADLDHDWFPPGHHSHQVEQVGRTRVEQHLQRRWSSTADLKKMVRGLNRHAERDK